VEQMKGRAILGPRVQGPTGRRSCLYGVPGGLLFGGWRPGKREMVSIPPWPMLRSSRRRLADLNSDCRDTALTNRILQKWNSGIFKGFLNQASRFGWNLRY
jgi:hypothetical protein